MGKRERNNLSVSATADVLGRIDALVSSSYVDTSRSGIALACIREGLAAVEARMARGAGDPPLYKCVGRDCPGLPYKASERPHPVGCGMGGAEPPKPKRAKGSGS